jgi:uncharacterized membrane protein
MLARTLAKAEGYTQFKDVFKKMLDELTGIQSIVEHKKYSRQLKCELAQLNLYLKHDQSELPSIDSIIPYQELIQQCEQQFYFKFQKVPLKHNMHNRMKLELKKRSISYVEE